MPNDRPLAAPSRAHVEVLAGCALAAAYDVASVCRPLDVGRCRDALEGAVAVGTVVGFPGASTTAVKAAEAAPGARRRATELDMVLPIGWLRSGEDAYVDDIAAVVAVALAAPSSRSSWRTPT